MPLGSTTAKNSVLDATLGASQPVGFPSPFYLALFNGDPATSGTELVLGTGGYARAAIAKTAWNAASAGTKTTNVEIAFAVSSGTWSATATHAALMSASTGGTIWDTGPLGSSLTVTGGTTVKFPAGNIVVSQG